MNYMLTVSPFCTKADDVYCNVLCPVIKSLTTVTCAWCDVSVHGVLSVWYVCVVCVCVVWGVYVYVVGVCVCMCTCQCGSYMSNEHMQLERVLRGSCSTHNIG